MRKFHKLILSLIVLFIAGSISFANAQEDGKKAKSSFDGYWYINGNVGFTNFYGDMHPHHVMTGDERLGYGANFGYQFSPVFGARANFLNGKYQSTGDPENNNLSDQTQDKFESSMWDGSAQLTIDFTNIFRKNKEAGFGIYGFAGVGWLNYSSMRTDINSGAITKRDDGTEYRNGDYSDDPGNGMSNAKTAITIPTGLGMYFNVSPKVAINIESSLRFSNTDEIDMREGGAKEVKNDFYGYTSLGLTYKFRSGSGLKKMKKDCEEVKYEVTPEVLQTKGDKVHFTVQITFPEKYFGKKSALRFAPYLKYGDQKLELPAKFFRGEKCTGDGDVVPYATGGTYTYETTFDSTPDMASSELYVLPFGFDPKDAVDASLTEEDLVAKKYNTLEMCETKLADGIRNTGALAGGNESTNLGEHGYELETVIAKTATLYFPKNKYNYSKNFGENKSDDAKEHRKAIHDFLAQGWDIKDITTNAYASPEGEETYNANLSENRANTANKFIEKEVNDLAKEEDSNMGDVSDVNYNGVGNGPDWDGFMASLQASDIEDKNTMINVIQSAAPEKKEEEIRNMILIYPELEDDILSPLRRAEITANCFEPKRSAEEISRLATTDPSELTTEELLYAATLTEDKEAKAQIYKNAAKLHSDSWEAQNNAAVCAIHEKDYSAALSYLDQANSDSPNNPAVMNNYGVVYAKQGNWDKAEQYFNDAKELGNDENYNLGVVAIQHGEYEKALSLFGNQKCDFNVALAQALLEKYEEANSNLECASATCKTNYLQAVIAARTGKDSDVINHLSKAIEMNPKSKNRASTDKEFINYFNNEDFINLVK